MNNTDLTLPVISPRLKAVANMVRPGTVVADIGTDHAYLPIYLVLSGVCEKAIASDVVDGPLANAKENVQKYNLSGNIRTFLTNGLNGIEKFEPDEILICGMGGELIISILENSEYVKNPPVHLILQPMTMAEKLRIWLCKNGFFIENETLVEEKDCKIYQIISASYVGRSCNLNAVESYLGSNNIKNSHPLLKKHATRIRNSLNKKLEGKIKAGHDVSELQSLIEDIDNIMEKIDEDCQ